MLNIFLYICWPFVFFFREMSIQALCQYFRMSCCYTVELELFFFLVINSLPDVVSKYFLLSMGSIFHSVDCFFGRAEGLQFSVVPFAYFCFCCWCSWYHIQRKKNCLGCHQEALSDFLLMIFTKNENTVYRNLQAIAKAILREKQ